MLWRTVITIIIHHHTSSISRSFFSLTIKLNRPITHHKANHLYIPNTAHPTTQRMICYRSIQCCLLLLFWNSGVVTIKASSASWKSTPTPSAFRDRKDPLLLRAARGEEAERFPVWMMRQAGRHMLAYRKLLHKFPTFRQRSETPEVSRTISLQPLDRCECIKVAASLRTQTYFENRESV